MTSELRIELASWGVRRPGRFRRWSGLVSLGASIAGSLSLGTNGAEIPPGTYSTPHPASSPGGLLIAIAFFAMLAYMVSATAQAEPADTPVKGPLHLSRGQLTLTGERPEHIALAHIEAGWEDDQGRAVFRLRDGRELTIDSGTPRENQALLEAAGIEQRLARLPVGSALSTFPLGKVLGGAAVFVLAIAATAAAADLGGAAVSAWRGLLDGVALARAGLVFALPLLGLLGLLRLLAPRMAVVGKDGVAVEGIFQRRFLPYSEIADIEEDAGVTLVRKQGLFPRVRLPRAPGGDGLLQRVCAAMKAHGDGTARIRLDRLDRRGRPMADWLSELKRMTDRSLAGYRMSALLPDQLAAVVEDAAVSPERRLAAAASIAASGDQEARTRVRIAAETSADLELRAALEQAAEGEIPEEALMRISRSS